MHIFYFVSLLWKKFYILFGAFFFNSVRGNFFIYPIITTECLTSASYVCGNAVSYTIFSLSALLFCISNVLFCVYFVPMIFGFVRRFIRWKFLISYSHSCIYYFVYFGYIVDFENSFRQIIAIYAILQRLHVLLLSATYYSFLWKCRALREFLIFDIFIRILSVFAAFFCLIYSFGGRWKGGHFWYHGIIFVPILFVLRYISVVLNQFCQFAPLYRLNALLPQILHFCANAGHHVVLAMGLLGKEHYAIKTNANSAVIVLPYLCTVIPYYRTVPYRIMTFSL